jgi:hypothetical protein
MILLVSDCPIPVNRRRHAKAARRVSVTIRIRSTGFARDARDLWERIERLRLKAAARAAGSTACSVI